MPYRLKNGVYTVRCRHPHCTFDTKLVIEHNIMGMTKADVESEALNTIRGMAMVKHDSLRVQRHTLRNPEIHKLSGTYQLIGAGPCPVFDEQPKVVFREFSKGEIIIQKGEEANSVCEVLDGCAYPQRNKSHRYGAGDCFGAAALLTRQPRMASVISGRDRTRVAFYNFAELSKRDPKKARVLYNRVMEDTFKLIGELEQSSSGKAL
jgi:hypothetical protein